MASKVSNPLQGEVWLFDPDPVRGTEIGKKVRPTLIVSINMLNEGPSGLVIVAPVTSKYKGISSHIPLTPPEGGVDRTSYVMCEQVRAISKDRLVKKLGSIQSRAILSEVHSWLTDLLWLDI